MNISRRRFDRWGGLHSDIGVLLFYGYEDPKAGIDRAGSGNRGEYTIAF